MYRYYKYLTGRMLQLGMDRKDLAERLGMSEASISRRFSRKVPWTIQEMYEVLDILQETHERLGLFFPRDGIASEEGRWIGFQNRQGGQAS